MRERDVAEYDPLVHPRIECRQKSPQDSPGSRTTPSRARQNIATPVSNRPVKRKTLTAPTIPRTSFRAQTKPGCIGAAIWEAGRTAVPSGAPLAGSRRNVKGVEPARSATSYIRIASVASLNLGAEVVTLARISPKVSSKATVSTAPAKSTRTERRSKLSTRRGRASRLSSPRARRTIVATVPREWATVASRWAATERLG